MPRVTDAERVPEGEGMVVRRALPNALVPRLDPFLLLDHMGPTAFAPGEEKGAPDHPHVGFTAVTFLLQGALEHEDSLGNRGVLRAGDVQWMNAGAGLVHSEMPRADAGPFEGLQLWVALPAAHRSAPPAYRDVRAADVPVVDVPGGRVRVVAGRFRDAHAPAGTPTPVTWLHAELTAGARVELPVPEGHHAFAYVVRGDGRVAGARVREGQLALVPDGAVRVDADGAFSVALLAGAPLREPVFRWGPFVTGSRAAFADAVDAHEAGRFGRIDRAE